MKKLAVCFFVLVFVSFIFTQKPSQQRSSPDKALVAKLDSLFKELDNTSSPGCAVTVIKDGRILASRDYGMASLEHQVPFTHQNVVRIPYSEGREFISTAAILMEQDGLLKLDDKVRKYFPRLPGWAESVTLWDLLNHRSGFVDEWANILLTQASMENRFDKSQFLKLLYTQPVPEIEPGKGYMYSNSDFGLLRLILEKASGQDLAPWMEKRIFAPLKMNSTRLHNDAFDVIPRFAKTYYRTSDNKYKLQWTDKSSPGGNYFIATSAGDLARWAAALGRPESDVARAAARLMKNVRLMPGKSGHYIFGRSIIKIAGLDVIFHEGVNDHRYLSRVPESDLAVITIGNLREGCGEENIEILNSLLKVPEVKREKPVFLTKPVPVAADDLKQYEGKYLWQGQTTWESYSEKRKTTDFFVSDGVLKARWNANYVLPLVPVGKDLFYFTEEDFGAQFEFKRDGPAMKLIVKYDDGFPANEMVRESGGVWTPSKDDLARFIGKYYSKHLGFYWTIALNENGGLIIKRPTIADTTLDPDGPNRFRFTIEDHHRGGGFDGWVTFHPAEKGTGAYLTVWFPRVMNRRFDKVAD